jgi:CheY-like chemotaxis protein
MGQARQKTRAVLIVEDDAEFRSLAAMLLEDDQLLIAEPVDTH